MANKREQMKKPCCCPYCDSEMDEVVFPYCEACEIEVFYCPECHEALSRDRQVCPCCGADIKGEATKGGE